MLHKVAENGHSQQDCIISYMKMIIAINTTATASWTIRQ